MQKLVDHKLKQVALYGQGNDIKIGEAAANRLARHAPIKFTCPVCDVTYPTLAEALACRDQPLNDAGDLQVGDIVVTPSMYHNWYINPDSPWCAFVIPPDHMSKSHFDHVPQHVPYFVVTALHYPQREWRHRCVVTLASVWTNDDDDGKEWLRVGWNPADGDGHYSMFKVGETLSIAASSDAFWREGVRELLANCEPCDTLKQQAAELAAIGISARVLL